jgi:hypothetical protein
MNIGPIILENQIEDLMNVQGIGEKSFLKLKPRRDGTGRAIRPDRSRAQTAARFVQARMMLARAQAVARGAVVALRFTGTPDAAVLTPIVDGNRNGV